ncbi:AhpC/TSA family protein [Nocardia farcinica]|uniref:peroxiredoxin-like family protein n=1 Tax=Nocardia farcinica TaxID=37329 RepID=UPI0018941411|nr:peroxiredoxin-like family protein [Nocardia farcinica]MBF6253160.1 AhpC/TSA family protein [Nocardia farcinica]MBF6259320.1 AhpC/TSA family protein [Nocardia farcinica]MBF6264872.1 AhpC/TSA family protein [Nocardia farcinica]MBF6283658.1 AhpC/TSA family protein [Nocardia farcinica]MBF6307389.1 AhpC/TSA family protein [Nocardia farcinica]
MSLLGTVPGRTLDTVTGDQVPVPDPTRLIHLQFRRFAGCPVCHLHLRSFVTRAEEVAAAGVREVVVFHSAAAELRKYTDDLPFAVVADPGRALYREFGVETAPRAVLDPRAWPTILRAVAHAALATLRGRPAPPLRPDGGSLGLPADFLIAPDGRVLASHHGVHADDQWSVDELLARVPAPEPTP